MIVMDLKGGSWVGDLYQKFEAMCVEVEEVMYEDTFKYVEDQVRTVGDTVKKFYSDVMQDLLPPSSLDSEKAQDPVSTVDHDSKVSISMKTKLNDANGPEQLVKDFSVAVTQEDSLNYVSSCCPIYCVIKPCKPLSNDSAEEKSEEAKFQSQVTMALSDRATSEAKDLDCTKDSRESLSNLPSIAENITNNYGEVVRLEPCSCSDKSLPVHEDASSKEIPAVSHSEKDSLGICKDMMECYGGGAIINVKKITILSDGDMTTDIDGHFSTDSRLSLLKADLSTMITSNVEDTIEVDKELSMFDIETSSPFLSSEFRKCESNEEGFPDGQLDKVKLEESCVLVEKNIFSKTGLQVQKSYKKKIKDVLSPRRWSKGKRNQEHLAAWYEEQCGKHTMIEGELRKSETIESFESDWELL